jgi:hypothetical protein
MKFLLLLIFALPFSSIVFSQGIDSGPALDDNLIESKQYKRLIEKHSKCQLWVELKNYSKKTLETSCKEINYLYLCARLLKGLGV